MANQSKAKSRAKSSTNSIDNLRDRFSALDSTLQNLVGAINKVSDEITALQPLLETVGAASVESTTPSPAPKSEQVSATGKKSAAKSATKDPAEAFLDAVNTLSIQDLIDKLKNAKARQDVIKNIIHERKKTNFQEFTSLEDLVTRIKGLAAPSLDKIIELWT